MIKPHDIPMGSDPRPESGRAAERDELGAYLAAVARDDCYRVVRPLGAVARMGADPSVAGQAGTITELVQFEGTNGATLGPFVRKRIDLALGVGTAYQELYEAQCSGARFAHVPRIVECYKTGRELVVVSEFIPGKTLDAFVNEAGPSIELSLSVVPAVCAAVAELHKAFDPPVVHRDLKPANIIVSEGPSGLSATLIDFGIARRYREGAAVDTVRFGTRSYAPPEQYGFGQTSVRSDIYALGMIALFCITGEEAHGQPSAESLAHAGVTGPYADAILQATSFDPERRFASAEAFCTAFARRGARGGQAVSGEHIVCVECTARGDLASFDGKDTAASGVAGGGRITPAASGVAGGGRTTPAASSVAGGSRTASNTGSRASAQASTPRQRLRATADLAKRMRAFARRMHTVAMGHAWNILLALVALLFIVIATQQVGGPINGQMYPFWYAAYITYVLCLPIVLGILYLMVDRRSLACVAPRLAARPRRRDARTFCIYLVFAFAVGVIASLFV
ncbi:protein kinase [Enorma massiliensis]|uniref:serine/threonine protein kinase n=1 Tax=Enorma massiliensis TaxID=1472761 RepID=UPI00195EFA47|nr:protein kinase [Enorma massiliensis]MBM6784199.1 protein kinase [Enorma massiliensis]